MSNEELVMRRFAILSALLLSPTPAWCQDAKPEEHTKTLHAARDRGLAYLTKNQAAEGSWGKTHPIAVTSFACLSYLSANAEPFDGDHGKALMKGLGYLMA